MNAILTSPWSVSLIGGILYLVTTAILIHPDRFERIKEVRAVIPSPSNDPSWRFRNPEFEQWVAELKAERSALAQREKELAEFQTRLQAERQEIFAATQIVHQLQKEFDRNVLRLKEQEKENLKRQTKVIAEMSPEGAAAMLSQMPEEEIVRLLFTLKADQSGGILDALSKMGVEGAKLAAKLTERLRAVLPEPTDNSRSPF